MHENSDGAMILLELFQIRGQMVLYAYVDHTSKKAYRSLLALLYTCQVLPSLCARHRLNTYHSEPLIFLSDRRFLMVKCTLFA